MSKILLLGDTHGNTSWFKQAILLAFRNGITHLVQVGDFGYWEHTTDGGRFLKGINIAARDAGVTVYWLDGNHENHPLLWSKYTQTDDEGFIKVRPSIRYIPRGHTWNWEGIKFLAVGGACSIDRDFRTPGTSWWPEEQITDQDVSKAVQVGRADVLLTHEAPNEFLGAANFGLIHDDMSLMSRLQIDKVGASARPRLWIHGHMHARVTYSFRHADGCASVEALACDNMAGSYLILDLPSLEVST